MNAGAEGNDSGLVRLIHSGYPSIRGLSTADVSPGWRDGPGSPRGASEPVWQAGGAVARSEHSGDDGEGHGRAAGLQLQGCQEALGGRCVVALSLEGLAQPVPDLVGGRVHLHCVPEDLLS